ncbi:hypothetical protein IV507_14875 [Acinetobacter nosocomialis]|uniref:hypothetical protein n=1 Tax=Acinetobacter nosocomialis TaxID=106654 RepID=UPI002F410519
MTLVNKTLVSIAMGLALTACGGSGSDGGTWSAPQTPNTGLNSQEQTDRSNSSGTVTAAFVPTATANMMLIPFNGFTLGKMDANRAVQNNDGSYTKFENYELTGDKIAVKDIAGNQNFALGRWSYGTAKQYKSDGTLSSQDVLQKSQNLYWTYAVYNAYTQGATSVGKKTCEVSAFTKPYLTNWGHGSSSTLPNLATSTAGTAEFELLADGKATFKISITTTNGRSTNTATYSPGQKADFATNSGIITGATTIDPTSSINSNGQFLVQVGQGLNKEVLLIASYTNQLSAKGERYSGQAVFTCK